MNKKAAKKAVEFWLDEMVIGLNLCPFARPAKTLCQITITISDADDEEGAFKDALQAIEQVVSEWEQERTTTTLIAFPQALTDFETFWDWVDAVEEVIEQSELDDIVQLAHFHPDYRFEGEAIDSHGHYTNRAPFPILHILQVDHVSVAADNHPDPKQIPYDNIAKLEAMTLEEINAKIHL